MTTARKLWLGFGTLTALLVLLGIAIIVRVRSLEAKVDASANVARPRSEAARELEINVLLYAVAVRANFQSDDTQLRQEAELAAANIERHLTDYQRLAESDQQREYAARFVAQWSVLKDFGQQKLNSSESALTQDDSKRLIELRRGLVALLADGLKRDAVATFSDRREAMFRDIRAILTFAIILLTVGVVIAVLTSGTVGQAILRNERTIAEQAERLRMTLTSIGDAVVTTDAEGRVTNLNPVAESLTRWTNAEAAGQPLEAVFRIVNEATRQSVKSPVAKALREGVIVGLANHPILIAKDGTERPIDDSAAPIHDSEGNIIGVVLVFRDITERKKTEAALRRSEQDLRDFFDHASVGLHWVGPDGSILRVNQNELDLLGYRPEEYLGRHIADFHVDRPVIDDILVRLTRGETLLDYPARLRCKDGSIVDVLINSNVLFEDGKFIHTRCFTRDVTEQKRAEAALLESERRLAKELAATKQLQDTSTRLINENDVVALYDQLLAAAVGIMGSDMASMQRLDAERGELSLLAHRGFDPKTVEAFWIVRSDTGCTGGEALRTGKRAIAPDIEVCDFIVDTPGLVAYRHSGIRAVQSTPLVARSGQLLGMISTHWRTTHQPTESELQLFDVLARQAADLIARRQAEEALRQLNADLSEADRHKNEFMAILGHELRNPLAPLLNAVQILDVQKNDEHLQHKARAIIKRQVTQMTRLVEELLEVSRITTGRIQLHPQRLDINTVVQNALETTRPLIDKRRHQLTVSLPPEPLWLHADATRLEQVVVNLITNAAKYANEGGQVWISVEQEGAVCVLKVGDTGIGISPELLPRIFDLFTQAERSLDRSEGGLGIGLSLVKRLTELHGGTVEASSILGKGSEFVVRLPISPTAALSAPTTDQAAVPTNSRSLRVLVVDDNLDAAQSMVMMLEYADQQVRMAHTGPAALKVAGDFKPNVMLIDIGLPELDGYEVAQRIRQQSVFQDVVLVAMTGYGQEADQQMSLRAGFNYHLVKPVDFTNVKQILSATADRIS